MLVEFFVENYGPFRERATLDLRKGNGNELPDNIIRCDSQDMDLLRSAIIFGKNSSGKSYVLKAMGILKELVRAVPPPNESIPFYNPFRLSRDTIDAPTRTGLEFVYEGIRYRYEIAYDSKRILEESLYHRPNKRMMPVFRREGQEIKAPGSRSLEKIVPMASPNAPFLTVAAQFNDDVCRRVHLFIKENVIVIGDYPQGLFDLVVRDMTASPSRKDRMVRAMAIADFGIKDFRGEAENVKATDLPPEVGMMFKAAGLDEAVKTNLSMMHEFRDADVDASMLEFPYQMESLGTIQMFCLMGPVIDALEHGKVILIDEFGSSLHTELSRWILSQFKSGPNPNDAQIIVNTHDLMLMDTDTLFRRDQILFADKDADTGAASVYCLTDYRGVRKDMDIQKSYLVGRFGAMPYIDRGDII